MAREERLARLARQRGKQQPFPVAPPLHWHDALWLAPEVSVIPKLAPAHEDPVRPNGLYNIFSATAGAFEDLRLQRSRSGTEPPSEPRR